MRIAITSCWKHRN